MPDSATVPFGIASQTHPNATGGLRETTREVQLMVLLTCPTNHSGTSRVKDPAAIAGRYKLYTRHRATRGRKPALIELSVS